jgi:3',5'-cyclic AMP phosphodiesterase CpdA
MTRRLCTALAFACVASSALSEVRARSPDFPVRIALVSDTHVRIATNADQALAHGRFHRVIAGVNAARVDLVLIAGDLTEFGRPSELKAFKEHIRAFAAPVWYVPGNHDLGNKLIAGKVKTDSVNPWRPRLYEGALGPTYFSRPHAGLRVIGLNSPVLGSGFPIEKRMWEFLEKQLAPSATAPTLVLTHYPLFVKTADETGGDYWNIEPKPRQRLLALLKKGGVKLVLSGHLHRELIHRHDGILFVTTPPVSFGLPKAKQLEGWTLVTMSTDGEPQIEFRHLPRE